MNTLVQPHVDEGAARKPMLSAVRAVGIASISGTLAVIVALVLQHLPVEGLVIAPRVMVPL